MTKAKQEPLLPPGYEELEPFVDYWAGEDGQTRWDRRASAEMDTIRTFYDAMLPRAKEALLYLNDLDIANLPGPEARLFRLTLSLAHAAMAIEVHGQPRALHAPFPHSIRLVKGPDIFA
jgi:hypothetical protein